jgi:general L-amino acid transport system permease protein
MRASRWWSADPMTSISDAPQTPLPFNSARSRKVPGGRVIRWLRANLFASVTSSIISLLLIALLGKALVSLVQWGYWYAIWSVPGDQTGACRSIRGLGACWAVIPEKYRFILFGTYPFGLMWGGIAGLSYVSQDRWGGLPVTLILATFGLAFGFPLGIVVALGRRSKLPAIRSLCVLYVELIRGVPLISLLFMASVMFPLFMPDGVNIDKLLRAQIAFVLYAGAYLAEVVRGGLQAIPRGQHDAADALGLSYWKKNGLIILPQAIRHVIPPLVNTFIAFFKDTSLVLIIGIFDLLTTAKTSIIDPAWQPFSIEVYVFVGLIYFAFCFAMSRYSRSLEAQARPG